MLEVNDLGMGTTYERENRECTLCVLPEGTHVGAVDEPRPVLSENLELGHGGFELGYHALLVVCGARQCHVSLFEQGNIDTY